MHHDQKPIFPLERFYASAGRSLPPLRQVSAEEIPQPYRGLLVHENDMTPTLERFHGDRIHLRVLAHQRENSTYARMVVLVLDGSARPVEFGAIVIHLQPFPEPAREAILAGYSPLGSILAEHGIQHSSCVQAYLQVTPDAVMREALGLRQPRVLYGRCNILLNAQGVALAEIVEILPP